MKEIKLNVQSRTENDKLSDLREAGFIPAVVYGLGAENVNIKVKKSDFDKAFATASKCGLIDLIIDGGEAIKVLVKDVQKNAIKGTIFHVDFYKVTMDKEVEVEIPLSYIGESRVVKEMGGSLVKCVNFVKIKALPSNLVSEIVVDLSELKSFDDCIRISSLNLGEGMKAVGQGGSPVVNVVKPKVKGGVKGKQAEKAEEASAAEAKTEEAAA